MSSKKNNFLKKFDFFRSVYKGHFYALCMIDYRTLAEVKAPIERPAEFSFKMWIKT